MPTHPLRISSWKPASLQAQHSITQHNTTQPPKMHTKPKMPFPPLHSTTPLHHSTTYQHHVPSLPHRAWHSRTSSCPPGDPPAHTIYNPTCHAQRDCHTARQRTAKTFTKTLGSLCAPSPAFLSFPFPWAKVHYPAHPIHLRASAPLTTHHIHCFS